jgi:hypothetical protein
MEAVYSSETSDDVQRTTCTRRYTLEDSTIHAAICWASGHQVLCTTGQYFLQTYIKEAYGNKDHAANALGVSKRANKPGGWTAEGKAGRSS